MYTFLLIDTISLARTRRGNSISTVKPRSLTQIPDDSDNSLDNAFITEQKDSVNALNGCWMSPTWNGEGRHQANANRVHLEARATRQKEGDLPQQVRVGIIIASVLLLAGFVFMLVYFREVIFKSCLKNSRRVPPKGRYPPSHFTRNEYSEEGPLTPLSPMAPPYSSRNSQFSKHLDSHSRRSSVAKLPLHTPRPFSTAPSIRSTRTAHTLHSIKTVPYKSSGGAHLAEKRASHPIQRSASFSPPSYTKEVFVAKDYIPRRPPPAILPKAPLPPVPSMPSVHELPAVMEIKRAPTVASFVSSQTHYAELPDRTSKPLPMQPVELPERNSKYYYAELPERYSRDIAIELPDRNSRSFAVELPDRSSRELSSFPNTSLRSPRRETFQRVELAAEPVIREENHEASDRE